MMKIIGIALIVILTSLITAQTVLAKPVWVDIEKLEAQGFLEDETPMLPLLEIAAKFDAVIQLNTEDNVIIIWNAEGEAVAVFLDEIEAFLFEDPTTTKARPFNQEILPIIIDDEIFVSSVVIAWAFNTRVSTTTQGFYIGVIPPPPPSTTSLPPPTTTTNNINNDPWVQHSGGLRVNDLARLLRLQEQGLAKFERGSWFVRRSATIRGENNRHTTDISRP